MRPIQVADVITELRKKWYPLAERQVAGFADDLLTATAEYTLKRSFKLASPEHVRNCYAKRLFSYIKNAARERKTRDNYIESQLIIQDGEVDWGHSDRYELRQALNIALGSLPDDTRIDVWRLYCRGDSLSEIASARGIKRSTCYSRITMALKQLRSHPALKPWRPIK